MAVALLVLAAALNLWLVTRNWRANLLDTHEFRQVQTALTAHYLRQDGVRLDYHTPILGAPWAIPMEFPTYQACVAWLSRGTGLPLEPAGRLTSLIFFYAGLPALFLLLRRWAVSVEAACCTVAAVLTSPLYLFYSRTFMIESTALCFSLWFLLGFWDVLHGPRGRGLALAWLAGTLGILTKVTTFAVFGVPALLLGLAALRADWPGPARWRRLGWSAVTALPILLAGVWWVRHSDALKLLNPYASFLTSADLRSWNFGTLAQRLSPGFWSTLYENIAKHILCAPALLLLLAGWPLLGRAGRLRMLFCLVGFSGGFLVFANLYFIHDYYYYGSAVFLLAAGGIVAGGVLHETRLPWLIRALLVGGTLLVGQCIAFYRSYGAFYRQPNAEPTPIAEILRVTTAPSDVVVAFGLDWNGQLAYFSQRRALMVPNHGMDQEVAFTRALANLAGERIAAVVVVEALKKSPYFLQPRLQQLGMEGAPIAETDDLSLYLRSDVHARAIGLLRGHDYPGVQLMLERQPLALDLKQTRSLESAAWRERLGMMSPAPYGYQSVHELALVDLDGTPVVNAHAPSELYFHPPAGARHIRAQGGLLPSAYAAGNTTDGIILQIFEESTPGQRRLLFERALRPLDRILNREPAVIELAADHPFAGTLVFRIDPGPKGSTNFDWAYWSRIEIR
jgi:hypothetical protein